jgi:long-chain acyl-CoA synthetase
VPATLAPYPHRTLVDYLSDLGRDHADDPALLFKGATITYRTLDRLSDAFAAALAGLGVAAGDRVGLLLPNCPQFFIAEFGAWKAGAIVAPINPIYTETELEASLADNHIDTIVTLTRYYERVKRVQPKTSLRRVIATNVKEYFPAPLRLLYTIARERREGDRITLSPGDHDLQSLLRWNAGHKPPARSIDPTDSAVLLLSGGTTGTPKGVLGKHSSYVISALQIQAWTAGVLEAHKDVIFLPLPLFHVYANVGVQGLALITGCPIALVPNPRDLNDLLATIRRVKPAFLNGVPTLYVALLHHPDVQSGKFDFRSIKICFSGAAPLLAETKRRFESLTGGRIVEGYSLTEAMMALCVNPVRGTNKIGSVGMPLPDVSIRIVDPDEGTHELPSGEVGEICFAAPQLMAGFLDDPEETAQALRVHAGAGGGALCLHTGDLGYLDEDGYVFIVDRKKDLIKTSGYQVWPREIEETLALHPAVADVGVAGVADELKGEAVHAWVVRRKGEAVSEGDLRAFCRERLAPYKVPSKIEFRADLPKTLVGKVLRRGLKDTT